MRNILFLLSDDQGAWATGCSGNREIVTPNLDRIAAEGMRLTRFFLRLARLFPSPRVAVYGADSIPARRA